MNRRTLAPFILTALVLVMAIAAVLIPVALATPDPLGMIDTFLLGPFRNFRHTGNLVEMATPAMLCGLAVALMFRAGMFNLGVEGAFFFGGLSTAAIVILVPLPSWAIAPVALAGGMIIGSSSCVVPGVLRNRFEVSELVSSLMLNFAVMFIGLYVVNSVLRDPSAGAMVSYRIPADARLPRIVDGTRIHLGTVLAFLACIAGSIYLFRTKAGYESRIVGANPRFAAHLGLPIRSIMLRAQILGGTIAAFAGGIEILGLYQRFSWQSLPGNGWTGVVVAILARDRPLLLIPSALFLSYLQVGGDLVARNHDVPNEVVGLIQALILILVTASAITRNPRLLALLSGTRKESSA